MLQGERLGGSKESVQQAAMLCGQPTVLGGCQAVIRQDEVDDILDAVAQALDLLFQMNAQRTERRDGAGLWPHCGQRVEQDVPPVLLAVRHLHGIDQGHRLLSLQAVLFNGGTHILLLVLGKSAEAVGQRHADAAGIQLSSHRRAQVLGQRQPLPDPAGLFAAGRRDGGRPHLLLAAKVPHHPGLIHRCQGARRPIGQQQGDLGLGIAARLLQHNGHLTLALGLPTEKALESIEHLEGAVTPLQHAQGHLAQRRRPGCWQTAATQRQPACPKLPYVDEAKPGCIRRLLPCRRVES
jgi:hypothetical protein